MGIIRLYCSNLDIKPKVILDHFLRYLGFYIEEISAETKPSGADSVANIYVLSDNFKDEYLYGREEYFLDIENSSLEETIFICKDGWQASADFGYSFAYNDETGDQELLLRFVSCLSEILEMQFRLKPLLMESAWDMEEELELIVTNYVKYHIRQYSIYAYRFYRQPHLFTMAKENYQQFVMQLSDGQSDLMKFAKSYAQYEMDAICRKNSRYDLFPVDEITDTCLELLGKYPDNEQIRILLSDIYIEMEEAWAKAANEYGDIHLRYCAYAHYKRGRILRKYARDYDSALQLQKWAVRYKNDYYSAWYQIALCNEAQGRYEEAVHDLEKVCNLLNQKCQKGLLDPLEYEYLYKAIIKIVQLQRNWLGDFTSAQRNEQLLNIIKREVKNTKFLKIIWEDIDENTEEVIKNTIWETLKISCEA